MPDEEQAALRRVATLVAQGTPPDELFAAVTGEIGRLLAAEYAFMGRYEPDGMFVVATWGSAADRAPVGSRTRVGGKNLVTTVLETARSARMDNYADASGPLGVVARETAVRSAVGSPILVEGRLWGVVVAGSTLEEPLPADTEARLVSFTELVATAISNAESRAGAALLAEEQAALRRVATLVASGTSPEEVFAAVTKEIGRLLRVEYTYLGRYEPDRMFAVVASWGRAGDHFRAGRRWKIGGRNLVTIVFETTRSARIDSLADASGPMGVAARESGIRAAVGTPILVEGRLWGVVIAGSTQEEPLPPHTEARLASFTELVATAIANAESRAGLARLAEEQAALRRVATLVAGGSAPEEVFAAVTAEVERLLPVDFAHLGRYEPDATITVLATCGSTAEHFPVGRRWSLGGNNLTTVVYESGRPARLDGYADGSGSLGVKGRELGIRSSVATPILVQSSVWGVVVAGSTLRPSLPRDTEARLASFTDLVGMAIANAESRAELMASRARIVVAGDESRRRIERDLHDGAQQRLVHAVIALKLALRALSSGDADAGELVAEALRHAEAANLELRELAHGILPAALTRGGLRAGIEALLSRVSLPVSVEISVERLPAGVEATAYFVISEALTNVVKHAHADRATVTAGVEGGQLRVEVRDDGVGGAPQGGDSFGLGGLEDRVSALGGRLVLESPPGGGTRVCALVPIPSQDQPLDESRR